MVRKFTQRTDPTDEMIGRTINFLRPLPHGLHALLAELQALFASVDLNARIRTALTPIRGVRNLRAVQFLQRRLQLSLGTQKLVLPVSCLVSNPVPQALGCLPQFHRTLLPMFVELYRGCMQSPQVLQRINVALHRTSE